MFPNLKYSIILAIFICTTQNICVAQSMLNQKNGFLLPKTVFSLEEPEEKPSKPERNVNLKTQTQDSITLPTVTVPTLKLTVPATTVSNPNTILFPKPLVPNNINKEIFSPQESVDKDEISFSNYVDILPFDYETAFYLILQELNNNNIKTIRFNSSNGRIIAKNQEKLLQISVVKKGKEKTFVKITPVDGMYNFNAKEINKLFESFKLSSEDYLKSLKKD
ncbi:MAG: hypothetical protein PHV68_04290 [Candidatus Gastranaerophilales bacterium]|nr:hypothetical protein [Candidatus Gastranaerophilales bacterium]